VFSVKTIRLLGLLGIVLVFSSLFAQSGRNYRKNSGNKNEVVTIKGTITSINHPVAMLKGDDGKTYEMRLGPAWFWKDHTYELKLNTATEIKGELSKTENTLYLYPYTITQAGSTIELADKDGAPTWSRRGNGQGRGMGRGNECCGSGGERNGNCRN
jgi:hypothetical protein